MDFLVFQRADSALIVVPALFQPPLACQRQGPVQLVGRCELDLDDFSPAVAAALAQDGFARVDGEDWQRLRQRLPSLPSAKPSTVADPIG